MLRKLNCFLNIVIGSFIGVFIGYGIYKFWHFKTYPNLYGIDPLKSLKYRFVVEVPKEVETDGKPLKATITSNGNTYIYNIR